MFCCKCGTQLEDGSKFCFTCGAEQQAAETTLCQSDEALQQGYMQTTEACPQPYQVNNAQESAYPSQEPPCAAPETAYISPEPETSVNYGFTPVSAVPAGQGYYSPEYGYPPPPESVPPVKNKGKLWWKIAIPAAAVIVIALAVGAYLMFFSGAGKMRAVSKAFIKLREEVTARVDGSPLKAVGILSDSVKDGQITLNLDFWDRWGSQIKGSASVNSRTEGREFAIAAGLSVNGEDLDAEAYINKERIAIGSKLLDNNYYGIKYSTFRDDVRPFGDLIGLDDETMDIISDTVEMIGDAMNAETGGYEESAYIDIFYEFAKSAEVTSNRVDIDSGGTGVKCRQIDFMFSEEAIKKLVADLYDEIESDDRIRDQFESQAFNLMVSSGAGPSYDEAMKMLGDAVRDFDRYFTGDITQSFFIGRGNRLLRVETRSDIRYDDERMGIRISIDFGASAKDNWTLNANVSIGSDRNTTKVVWEYEERTNVVENTLTITVDGDDGLSATLLWSPKNGDFRLTMNDGWSEMEITGGFTSDDKSFHLELDNLYSSDDEYLAIEIDVASGAKIKDIEYINVDRWGETLIDKVEDMINNLSRTGIYW